MSFGNKKEPKVLTKYGRLVKREVNIVDITIGGMPFIKKRPTGRKNYFAFKCKAASEISEKTYKIGERA